MNLLIKPLLTALAFAYLLPMIPGISFHGGFMMAIFISIMFGVMLWVTDLVALAISAMVTVSSLGLALLWLVPLWLLGFWLLPAVALFALSDIMPANLTVHGWVAAILGGLVMLLIGTVTSDTFRVRSEI
jgi:hypothetical protein